MWNKKGESLVEVVVSLGILSFLFTSAIVMISSTMVLNNVAKQRTEAISTVQKNMNNYLSESSENGVCSVLSYPATTHLSGATGCEADDALTEPGTACYWITVVDLNSNASNGPIETGIPGYIAPNPPIETNFKKLVSHGKWFTRPVGEQTVEFSKIIRNR